MVPIYSRHYTWLPEVSISASPAYTLHFELIDGLLTGGCLHDWDMANHGLNGTRSRPAQLWDRDQLISWVWEWRTPLDHVWNFIWGVPYGETLLCYTDVLGESGEGLMVRQGNTAEQYTNVETKSQESTHRAYGLIDWYHSHELGLPYKLAL